MNIFVLDACALIAHFAKENGAGNVKNILKYAIDDANTKVYMNKINLLEVYYDVIKAYNEQEADKMLETVKEMPIEIISELKDSTLKKAGQLKAKYKISLADSIALAESIVMNGLLVTSDHHEFEPIGLAVDAFDPKVIRASMGAIFSINVIHFDTFEEYMEKCKGHHFYPFMINTASSLRKIKILEPFSLIFGNESNGLPIEFNTIGQKITIKHSKEIDSLNISVAVGIALYEATKIENG